MKLRYFAVAFLLCIPLPSFASVRINEIAWMGTLNSANDEWIELYNTDSSSIDVSGWTLNASDGSPSIVLSGAISSNGYFLLERTDDETVPTVDADQIYSGALGNEGESLNLKDTSGTTIDIVNHSDGWEGGDNTTKDSMQYVSSGWVTASATPKLKNESSGTTLENDNDNSDDSHGSETESSDDVYDEEKDIIDVFTLRVQVDPVIVAEVPAEFTIRVYKNNVHKLKGIYSWNFGDGTFVESDDYKRKEDMTFFHTYHNPGTYVAIFEYRTSVLKNSPDVQHRLQIVVTEHGVEISEIHPGRDITLKNVTQKEIDLGGWKLASGLDTYVFPLQTIILPESTLTLAQKVVDMPIRDTTKLRLPNGSLVSGMPVEQPVLSEEKTKSVQSIIGAREQNISRDDAPLIRPLDDAATVVFSHDKEKGNTKEVGGSSIVWYILGLLFMVSISGFSIIIIFMHKQKTSTLDDVEVDDITILGD